jgi:hypothetical protein
MKHFEQELGRSDHGVVCIDVPTDEMIAWLVRIGANDSASLVVLADLTPAAVSQLWPLQRSGLSIVWKTEAREKLRLTLGLSEAVDPLAKLLADLQAGQGLSPIVLRALTRIFESGGPPQSFRSLAEYLSVAPSTLRHHWYVALGGSSPKELMDWVTLLRAVASDGEPSWASVACGLGRHTRTLERLSVRLTGKTLNSLRRHPSCVIASLDGWVKRTRKLA